MKSYSWKVVVSIFATSAILLCIAHNWSSPAKATVTKWWKVAPNTCSVNFGNSNDPDQSEQNVSGTFMINEDAVGGINVTTYCPVFLPDDAVVNKLRIRTFADGGIPSYTYITASLYRTKWDGTYSTLAIASMNPSDTYDDYNFSSTIDNENYHYLIRVYFSKTVSAQEMPELDMIEIRYEQ